MPNFDSSNQGEWFYFDDNRLEIGGVCLRELSVEEASRINRITVKPRKKVMGGIVVDDPKVDDETGSRMTWDYCITDWKEVYLDGKKLDCTTDSKVKMMKVNDFAKFVLNCLRELNENNKAINKALEKNLENSSSGKMKNPNVKAVEQSMKTVIDNPPVMDAM